MRTHSLLLFLFCAWLSSRNDIHAQELHKFTSIRTQDGSLFNGSFLGQEKNHIKLVIITGDTITINRYMVDKIWWNKAQLRYPNGKWHNAFGYFSGMSFAGNLLGEMNETSSQLDFYFGHRFNHKFALAVGWAFEFNSSRFAGFTIDTQFSTFYAYGRYYLTDQKRRIFVHKRIGYGSPAEGEQNNARQDHDGGINLMYGIGINFAAKKKTRFVLSLNMYHQKTSGTEFDIDGLGNEIMIDYDFWINRPMLKFTMEFN